MGKTNGDGEADSRVRSSFPDPDAELLVFNGAALTYSWASMDTARPVNPRTSSQTVRQACIDRRVGPLCRIDRRSPAVVGSQNASDVFADRDRQGTVWPAHEVGDRESGNRTVWSEVGLNPYLSWRRTRVGVIDFGRLLLRRGRGDSVVL